MRLITHAFVEHFPFSTSSNCLLSCQATINIQGTRLEWKMMKMMILEIRFQKFAIGKISSQAHTRIYVKVPTFLNIIFKLSSN